MSDQLKKNKENRVVVKDEGPNTPEKKQERKDHVLTQGTPSITTSIAEAVVIKNENIYFLTQQDGNVPLKKGHGFGLYYKDCRFLNGYELKLAGEFVHPLVANASQGFQSIFELTNPVIEYQDKKFHSNEVGIKWERILDAGKKTLFEVITMHNYGRQAVDLPLTLTFQSDFEDIFCIRGLVNLSPGEKKTPEWKDGALAFGYMGADNLYRSLSIHFNPAPQHGEDPVAQFEIKLEPKESQQLLISLVISEDEHPDHLKVDHQPEPNLGGIHDYFQKVSKEWLSEQTQVSSDSILLGRLLNRSLKDMRTLQNRLDGDLFYAAGVPWFVALFGRDSLISAMQILAFYPKMAAQTLRLLAKFQGTQEDHWRDEQPGKILHELRVGELARLGKIPHTPYYGSVDSTPLFLIVLARYMAWTGDMALFQELRENVERALDWIDHYGISEEMGGYVAYQSASSKGLVNQGWKDSGNAIVNADGSLAEPPIALVEVQGYVFQAKHAIADLYNLAGETQKAVRLRKEADELARRFNRDFWVEDKGFYALALQKDMRPATVISSNPGQALWSGIIDQDRAAQVADRLLQEDMFSGWGIRTLSSQEVSYNPISYHLGTVWPHDSALIAAGLRRYGLNQQARMIFSGIVRAGSYFDHDRLPELFSGFSRADYEVPVHYPVACHPQAWAAGSVPYLLAVFLGLAPEAPEKRLRIKKPDLPDFVNYIELKGLRVGKAAVDLRFERLESDRIAIHVLKTEGPLDVILE